MNLLKIGIGFVCVLTPMFLSQMTLGDTCDSAQSVHWDKQIQIGCGMVAVEFIMFFLAGIVIVIYGISHKEKKPCSS